MQRSPTWILPKPDRAYTDGEKWIFARVPFAKKIYRTRLWLRSESNISVIENGSDKTQEFKGIALKVLESTVADEELRRRLTVDYALRLMWAGVAAELHVFPGTCHGFDSLLPEWETSQQLFELQGATLRRALHERRPTTRPRACSLSEVHRTQKS